MAKVAQLFVEPALPGLETNTEQTAEAYKIMWEPSSSLLELVDMTFSM